MMTTVVLHNLPIGCQESDIHRALLIYGTAVSVKMDVPLSQAVATMRTQQEAQALLNRRTVNVCGASVRVDTQLSQPSAPPPPAPQPPQQRQAPPHPAHSPAPAVGYPYEAPPTPHHLAVPPSPPAQLAPQAYYAPAPSGAIYPPPSARGPAGGAIMPAPPQTSRRLRVVVEDCRYPITRDVLLRMFSMVAPPVMVSCGPYAPTTTGLVEFADAAAAQQAVDQFNAKAIYPDCCHVRLTFEPMWEVPLPSVAAPVNATPPPSAMMAGLGAAGYAYDGYGVPGRAGAYAAPTPSGGVAAPSWEGREERMGGYYGEAPRGRGQGYPSAAERRTDDGRGMSEDGGAVPPGISAGRGGRGAIRGRGAGVPVPDFRPYADAATRGGAVGAGAASATAAALAGARHVGTVGGRPTMAPPSDSAVLVSNVDPTVSLYDLWVLLEVYGNVSALKRQHSDRTQVVAQFQHVPDAVVAVQFLHGCPLRGHKLRLKRFLGYQERNTEWDVGPATDPATQAALFDHQYHHRVAPHVRRNPHVAMFPDKNLFVHKLTENVTDEDLAALWTRCGFEPTGAFRRSSAAAIVGFKDVETAVEALVAAHLRECNGRSLYVTFSRFPPGPRPDNLDGASHEQHSDGEGQEGEAEGTVSHPPPRPAPEVPEREPEVSADAESSAAAKPASKPRGRAAKK